jgi:hypothetical protein
VFVGGRGNEEFDLFPSQMQRIFAIGDLVMLLALPGEGDLTLKTYELYMESMLTKTACFGEVVEYGWNEHT